MSNDAFRRDFAKLIENTGEKVEDLVRKTALQLQTSMVELAPVDTGRFKGNFVPGIGTINLKNDYPPDKSGASAIDRTKVALQGWKAGQTIYLTNSLPYARVLEYGRANGKPGSMQAPGGVVRLTVQNYAKALAQAVSEIK